MSVSFSGLAHTGNEVHHYYRQDSAPTGNDPLQVGDLWSDTSANLLKRCTSTSPVTFVSVEGGSSAHDLFSATHGDVDETATPSDGQVLTFNSSSGKWEPSSAGAGDVSGPASAADENIAVFDGASGKAIKDGASKISDLAASGHDHDADYEALGAVATHAANADAHHAEAHAHTAADGSGALVHSKGLTVEAPHADGAENITMFFTDRAITIVQVNDVKQGGTSVTWNLRHATAHNSGTPNDLFASNRATSSEAGAETTDFTGGDPTIPAGSWVWLITSALSGEVAELAVTIHYTED